MEHTRIIEQLDNMVAKGRLTPEEAERLRTAEDQAAFEAAMTAVRERHARAHAEEAVASGRLGSEEAEEALARVRDGDHSRELRTLLRQGGDT